MVKFVLVTGGVVSGLGKGITASSVGLLLQSAGLSVTSIKIDPYLNIDAGTMSPYEHGEVFVLDDGGEADLDLGNYERFLNISLTKDHNITTGKVYNRVLTRERRGDYLGKTVQVVPHITNCIQDWISRVACIAVDGRGTKPDVCVIELGGTVGDIESMVFLEALRQFESRLGRDNLFHIHVSLVTVVGAVGEQKSKPTQHSVKELRSAGLMPNMLVCRSSLPLERSVKEKISMFSMVPPSHVISVYDVANIYQVPSMLLQQHVAGHVLSGLRFNVMPPIDVKEWDRISERLESSTKVLKIGLVGKYTGLADSYLSVTKALKCAAIHNDHKLEIVWITAENLAKPDDSDEFKEAWTLLKSVDGILTPGGFGDRGVQGKIKAAEYARVHNVPYLGICLGFQVAVIEFARNVLGWQDADSEEFDPHSDHKVVVFMPEISTEQMGGNMRLGNRVAVVKPKTLTWQLYNKKTEIYERHRHRYEVNPEFIDEMESAGLLFSAKDQQGVRMECLEHPDHKFFLGVQFHPEFKSRPLIPSPPFVGLIQAAAGLLKRSWQPKIDDSLANGIDKVAI